VLLASFKNFFDLQTTSIPKNAVNNLLQRQ